ncbi:hypothetical protein PTTG_12743 [Puccinia triticina 1-1 BBBD Race 1]|uniref:Uncharacterized protein n=2 Tax=Puccinia triticina TaxID=208348 RepID=A0A180G603_PUCT1|nr:uncharacterized protein PtA15_12A32 [Puccinia triticina]OAV88076.1 hypothetical protein PTTG_12743 [Puccinia triticina 1-1 BBBD Race 1]WAQ90047.1 hypothetical protein PtA15_12A32 [Puccinia triticina]
MEPTELQLRAGFSWETVERVQKSREILNVVGVLEGLTDKYSFEPEHLTPRKKDPNLTIARMAGKVQTFEKLHSIFLPSIRDQLTSLVNSLDLIDPKKNPQVVTDPTLEILSNLDKTIESTVSAIVSLTLESHLPDEKHDYGLEKLKVFRCSHLHEKTQLVVEGFVYEQLFRDVITSFIQWCALATVMNEDQAMLKEGSDLRRRIEIAVAYPQRILDETINWCRKSDWAIVQEGWLEASESCDEALETFICRTRPTIQSTSEADSTNDNDQRNDNRGFIVEVAKSAIPLIKLARILIKKTSGKISKKRLLVLGTTLELNSETMTQLYQTPGSQSIFRLQDLANLIYIYHHTTRTTPVPLEKRTQIRQIVEKIPRAMESTLTVLHSCLIPFLAQIEDQDSPETHLKSFLPILRQSWDTASDHLMDVILSFEVEQMAI